MEGVWCGFCASDFPIFSQSLFNLLFTHFENTGVLDRQWFAAFPYVVSFNITSIVIGFYIEQYFARVPFSRAAICVGRDTGWLIIGFEVVFLVLIFHNIFHINGYLLRDVISLFIIWFFSFLGRFHLCLMYWFRFYQHIVAPNCTPLCWMFFAQHEMKQVLLNFFTHKIELIE